MFTKEALIKRLRNDRMFRDAMKMARNDAERYKIAATAEAFISTFIDVMSPIAAGVRSDPVLASKLMEGIKNNVTLVRESDGKIMSGSTAR